MPRMQRGASSRTPLSSRSPRQLRRLVAMPASSSSARGPRAPRFASVGPAHASADARALARLRAARCAPYCTRPTPVAYCGPATSCVIPLTPTGSPSRTGMPRISSANSVIPSRRTAPPVRTTPAESCSSRPVSSMRLRSDGEDLLDARLDDVARARGARPCAARGRRRRGPRSPRRRRPCGRARSPRVRFSRSASAIGVRRPAEMSLVMLLPPTGMTLACAMPPST